MTENDSQIGVSEKEARIELHELLELIDGAILLAGGEQFDREIVTRVGEERICFQSFLKCLRSAGVVTLLSE